VGDDLAQRTMIRMVGGRGSDVLSGGKRLYFGALWTIKKKASRAWLGIQIL